MSEWTRVIWTTGGQIAGLLDWPVAPVEETPQALFERLRRDQRRVEAALVLGQALPRYQALSWAEHAVTVWSHEQGAAMDAVRAWLAQPDDAHRRACLTAADEAPAGSAQQLLALGVYCCGGSMAEPDAPEMAPPRQAAGKFAAVAVIAAADASGAMTRALDTALDAGDRLAREGLTAAAR